MSPLFSRFRGGRNIRKTPVNTEDFPHFSKLFPLYLHFVVRTCPDQTLFEFLFDIHNLKEFMFDFHNRRGDAQKVFETISHSTNGHNQYLLLHCVVFGNL